MELSRIYEKLPFHLIVLHGGPGAPVGAAGLCRALAANWIGIIENLQKAWTIEGLSPLTEM